MCEYCEPTALKSVKLMIPYYCDAPYAQLDARIEPLFNVNDKWFVMIVNNDNFDQEAYFAIRYCPMCGRKLGG